MRPGGADVAELVVLNTCTVTSTADDEVKQTIRRVHRENPSARILVTGCYAQRAPQDLSGMAGVSWVVGNSHKTRIPDIVTNSGGVPFHGEVHVGDIFAQQEFLAAPVDDASGDRTRPNLKIQDGCNNRCSFCIIPFVRGRSRSAPADQVIEQVRALAYRYREVVLSGINLGRWGREPGSAMRLPGLLRRLLAETEVERLRLSSVEPMDVSDDLLELMASSPRIAKHVHAPLQSGSDRVLRRMHRKYRPRHYEDRVRKARALMPDAAIGGMSWRVSQENRTKNLPKAFSLLSRCPSHISTFSLIQSGQGRLQPNRSIKFLKRCARNGIACCAKSERERIWSSGGEWSAERCRP
jgi:threonylcarbamoyladenosine tRNA methylthiotransferase MtaB